MKLSNPRHIFAVLWLLAPLLVYSFHLNGGWRFDDGHHLLFLSEYRHFDYIYDQTAARLQSGAHYTPFNILTYDLAHRIFSFAQPVGFYFFHLLLLGAATAAFFLLLTRLVPTCIAVAGTAFFLCGFPIAGIAGQLMVGHYVVGFLFFSLSLYYYDCALAQKRISARSLLLFLLACMAKEIFVPMIVVVMIDPRTRLRERIKPVLAYSAVIAIFWTARTLVVGRLVGGFNNGLPLPAAQGLQSIVSSLLHYFFGAADGIALGIMIVAMLVCTLRAALEKYGVRSTLLICAGMTGMLFLPLLPVALQIKAPTEIRLITMIWYALAFCTAIGLQYLWQKTNANIARTTAGLLLATLAWNTWHYVHSSPLSAIENQFDRYSRYVIDKEPCNLADNFGWSSWAHDLYQAIYPGSSHPLIAPEAIILAYSKPGVPICRNHNGTLSPAPAPSEPLPCAMDAPLYATFRYNGSHITFLFGPDPGMYYLEIPGKYFLSLFNGYTGPMPNTARFENIRVIQIKENGTLNCSPLLHFEPLKQPELSWQRT